MAIFHSYGMLHYQMVLMSLIYHIGGASVARFHPRSSNSSCCTESCSPWSFKKKEKKDVNSITTVYIVGKNNAINLTFTAMSGLWHCFAHGRCQPRIAKIIPTLVVK